MQEEISHAKRFNMSNRNSRVKVSYTFKLSRKRIFFQKIQDNYFHHEHGREKTSKGFLLFLA